MPLHVRSLARDLQNFRDRFTLSIPARYDTIRMKVTGGETFQYHRTIRYVTLCDGGSEVGRDLIYALVTLPTLREDTACFSILVITAIPDNTTS